MVGWVNPAVCGWLGVWVGWVDIVWRCVVSWVDAVQRCVVSWVCGLAGWTLSGGVWVDVLLTVECLQQLCSVHININVYISTDEYVARCL